MKINDEDSIEHIAMRISTLQIAHVSLQEQFKQSQHQVERSMDDAVMRIIDILDMIEATKPSIELDSNTHVNAQLIMKKIEKKLIDMLKHWHVQEISCQSGRVEIGKTRVLETKKLSENISSGAIVEICRKGYQRDNKIIRPADVITAE